MQRVPFTAGIKRRDNGKLSCWDNPHKTDLLIYQAAGMAELNPHLPLLALIVKTKWSKISLRKPLPPFRTNVSNTESTDNRGAYRTAAGLHLVHEKHAVVNIGRPSNISVVPRRKVACECSTTVSKLHRANKTYSGCGHREYSSEICLPGS